MSRTPLLLATAALALGLTAAPPADACTCAPPPDLVWQWGQLPDDVVAARVVLTFDIGARRVHVTRVRRTFKGCTAAGDWLLVVTRTSSAACGLSLSTGGLYLLATDSTPLPGGRHVARMSSCDLYRHLGSLDPEERAWLSGRMVCCDGDCTCANGTAPVQCFADPCAVAPACSQGACEANTCGGCFAEHFTPSGELVCTPCGTSADCGPEQVCDATGQCVFGCATDADCPDTQWCRPSMEGPPACADYAQEGDYCGGFVPPWALSLCAPGLVCTDFIPYMLDGPGVCRTACKSNDDCAKDQYCAVDGVCREDASCKAHADCGLYGNDYEKPKCLGYGLCVADACEWVCGDWSCQDVEGVDFGDCEMAMGVGVVDGACQPISGCGPEGHTFFKSIAACEAGCGPACVDLADVFFGPCDAVLGVGVVDGTCQTISGCEAQGFMLFDSVKACVAACGAPEPCADAAGVDFGPCKMLLGWTIVDGTCQLLGGCETLGYTFYDSEVACLEGCATGCGPWYDAYEALSTELKACSTADTCVAVPGTSCGCTHNLVVNGAYDLTELSALIDGMNAAGCALISTCDCPPADGFVCAEGLCQWNYL